MLASALFFYLSASAAALSIDRRQDGPVDPSTDPDCNWYDNAVDSSSDCTYFEEFWGISHEDFVAWNPSVKDDCSGIKVGNSYCVEVIRKPTPTPSSSTPVATPTPTKTPKPSPVQDGVIDTCTNWYFAVANDDCTKITNKLKTFTVADFIKWNPAVGSACRDLWAETWYCVGIPGTPTAPVTTNTPSPTTTGTPKPSPTQEGLIEICEKFYYAVPDDTCAKVTSKFGTFTVREFITWNPAVGADCKNLQADVYYCVGIPGTPTAPPSSTKPSTPTSTSGNGISTPLPTQPSMVGNCDAFYYVGNNEGCQVIADKHGITLAQFLTWNPEAGASCRGLWADTYACVSIIGHTPSKPSTTLKTSTTAPKPTGCTVAHPTPTQGGSICNCKQWYLPAQNEYCADIEKKFGITATQFRLQWNPTVGSTCGGMWAASYLCVKG
ncbi:hypothetical protein BS50DRAFT_651682 [Corynespora cassiicola Philippines]|uniref:LysM domain-containing protein n=1 Tax=Corynespora cassiicola Philippines TaxID=1448308 RepID=A0A2T2N7R7_CORCC|nr:hypothetical protein BS50DRAFT_651682 [Corynespora cassiicola Philippines]